MVDNIMNPPLDGEESLSLTAPTTVSKIAKSIATQEVNRVVITHDYFMGLGFHDINILPIIVKADFICEESDLMPFMKYISQLIVDIDSLNTPLIDILAWLRRCREMNSALKILLMSDCQCALLSQIACATGGLELMDRRLKAVQLITKLGQRRYPLTCSKRQLAQKEWLILSMLVAGMNAQSIALETGKKYYQIVYLVHKISHKLGSQGQRRMAKILSRLSQPCAQVGEWQP